MLTCDTCTALSCKTHNFEKMPANCPMQNRDNYSSIMQKYEKDKEFFVNCALVEKEGYGKDFMCSDDRDAFYARHCLRQ